MRNKESWYPTKYVAYKQSYRANRDKCYVSISSRLIADLMADGYFACISKYACGDLLDLGCGFVPLYSMYRDQTKSQTCMDWQNTFHKNEFLDKECDLNKPLDIESEKYDTVILSDVLEHIKEPEALIREIYRITKPNGIFILGVPFYYWIHEAPYDYYRYTRYSLEYLMQKQSFSLLHQIPIGGVLDTWADLSAKIFIRIPVIGKFVSNMIQYVIFRIGKTKWGTKIRNKTSDEFPLGYIIVAKK